LVLLGALIATPPAGADPGLTLSASSANLGPDRTTVTVVGQYSCGPFASGLPDRGVIDFTVVQVKARRTVTAYGYLEPTVCDGTDQPFAATLTVTGTTPFRKGAATRSASGYVEGDTGLQHVTVPPTPITLTR
jgi:hypothetical protein